MKKRYIMPETTISEFKGKQMAICLSIGEGYANGDDALTRRRDDNTDEWGDRKSVV